MPRFLGRAKARRNRALLRQGVTILELIIALAVVATLAMIAIPTFRNYLEKGDTERAISDLRELDLRLEMHRLEFGGLPLNLSDAMNPVPKDPWGNDYQYLNLEAGLPGTNGKRRRDKNMNPINSDYDIYSMGPDGQSQAQLVGAKARDDIVRAADGDYIGVAEEF